MSDGSASVQTINDLIARFGGAEVEVLRRSEGTFVVALVIGDPSPGELAATRIAGRLDEALEVAGIDAARF